MTAEQTGLMTTAAGGSRPGPQRDRARASPRGSRCDPGVGRFVNEPPLLLCNGIGVSLEALQPLVDHLDPERGIVRFDVPGIGGSQLPPFPYPIAGLASWVAALMTRLGHREFDVFGLSWGGGLAQQLAVQSRKRVRRVVLVATGTGMLMVPAHPRVLRIMSTPRRHRDPEYAAQRRSRDLRRHHAQRPRPRVRPSSTARPGRAQARLLLPAGRDDGLEQPAVPRA